eukprot:CAMPEP_0184675818 /NCGR_PEP_ID=MMETSP0308-20130426/88008_1 /TAXON_ID=38269 /ORGANISM="Gloeochaete witrockiana, Strain SAG 46.84" /LENGTH=298 /DNA_ID=CAMNT_0027123585 /DNA_START=382 /DNA_END=1278 /DNA_ORIENTATION=-
MNGQRITNKTMLCKLSNTSPNAQSAQNAEPSNNLYIKPLLSDTTEEQLRTMFSPFGTIVECKVMIDKQTGVSRQIGFVRFEKQEDADSALRSMNGTKLEPNAPPLVVKYAESESQKLSRRQRQQQQLLHSPVGPGSGTLRSNSVHAYSHIVPHQPQVGMRPTMYGMRGPQQMSTMPVPMAYMGGDMYQLGYSQPPPQTSYGGPQQAAQSEGVNLFVFHLPTEVDDATLFRLFSPFGALESVKVITDKTTGESKGYGFVKYFRMADALQSIQQMNGFQVGSKHLKVSFKTSGPGVRSNL